jgi:hypothetical protein
LEKKNGSELFAYQTSPQTLHEEISAFYLPNDVENVEVWLTND